MSTKADRSSNFSRARHPYRVTSTSQVIPREVEAVVSAIRVVGTTGGRTEFRTGDPAATDPIFEMQTGASEDADQDFPAGMVCEDGLHVTIDDDEVVYIIATE